ncbi:Gluconolactonase precursor [Labrenzia sp. THAF82]|uniref:SMP-30/gluconolactonase/LRE family protein n=1 Tax=Labrenzia sp. THAF82 TaxID=2587861 RepID=UPI0012681DFE|nr:SMP-30/gluconolactonase/LRE family protein [Labrenzia sp. THAF82]QFT30432.1 Gluconolactonase precursor [Labrenzia sp. THAF82]
MKPGYVTVDARFESFVDTSSEPEMIAEGCTWTEGPVWLSDGLFFNDIPGKRMLRWTEENGLSIALTNSEFANGNTLDLAGYMVSCEHGGRRVVRRQDPYDLNSVETIADSFEGNRLNSPNDVVVRSDGSVWFTDPPYGINSDVEGYPAESELGGCHVYCVSTDGAIHVVATDFDKPNGLAFSPDETKLYVADSGAIRGASFPGIDYNLPHHIRVFDVDGPNLSNSRVFAVIAPGIPDGFRVDHQGFVWTSALDGIHCLSPEGALIGKIVLPAQTSNICFGGRDGMTMFITSSDKVYRVRSSRRDAAQVLREKTGRPS